MQNMTYTQNTQQQQQQQISIRIVQNIPGHVLHIDFTMVCDESNE